MDSIRAAPKRLYNFIGFIIEIILLFLYGLFYINKPSGKLSHKDIDDIRHKKKPKEDMNKGGFGSGGKRLPMGG